MTPETQTALREVQEKLVKLHAWAVNARMAVPVTEREIEEILATLALLSPEPAAGQAQEPSDEDTIDCEACSYTGQADASGHPCGVCGGRGYFHKRQCINGCGEDATGGPEINDVGPFCAGCYSLLVDGLKARGWKENTPEEPAPQPVPAQDGPKEPR